MPPVHYQNCLLQKVSMTSLRTKWSATMPQGHQYRQSYRNWTMVVRVYECVTGLTALQTATLNAVGHQVSEPVISVDRKLVLGRRRWLTSGSRRQKQQPPTLQQHCSSRPPCRLPEMLRLKLKTWRLVLLACRCYPSIKRLSEVLLSPCHETRTQGGS